MKYETFKKLQKQADDRGALTGAAIGAGAGALGSYALTGLISKRKGPRLLVAALGGLAGAGLGAEVGNNISEANKAPRSSFMPARFANDSALVSKHYKALESDYNKKHGR